jgi:flagellar basal body-associated protein FliL
MSDDKEKAPSKGSGALPRILGTVLPAVFAAAAAFGGAKVAGAHHGSAPMSAEPTAEATAKPPGPTLALDPFLVTIPDTNKKNHPMKVTIAIEFTEGAKDAKEEMLKGLTPRIRDTSLGYFRTLAYEQVVDPTANDKMRTELLERLKTSGMASAERVLITDLVVQ